MKLKKFCCCWDLEGPISIIDFAAELGRKLNEKSKFNFQRYNMSQFFTMISNYDDYIIDVPGVKELLNIPEYQPGDTLRLMAPLYASCFNENDLRNLAKQNIKLLPGCKELMKILHKDWDIFVVSTSYSQFAYIVAEVLNIPKDHVYCTEFNIKKLKQELRDMTNSIDSLMLEIFDKYLVNNKNLDCVIDDLNNFFWKDRESNYTRVMNQISVIGGKRKEAAVEEISKRTKIPLSEMIVLGDSITDINMLQRIRDENGIAVSFNGNKFSVNRANVAVTTPNSLGVLPIFLEKHNIREFLEEWESQFQSFQENPNNIKNEPISEEIRNIFIKYNFLPEFVDLTNKSQDQLTEIILRQENMRTIVRGWVDKLT